ncbi:MAG TPA: ABC transporter substrate-binding protein [Stellaceae bacterium]|nr:ABC transporter substrate-binding protein [Stellaceae bacterium]
MPFRSSAAVRVALLVLALFGFGAPSARAAEFTDAADRHVRLPASIMRVMAANQAAAVLVFVLAPDKLVGWSRPLGYAERRLLPAKYARLPTIGRLAGSSPTATVATVARLRPDLVVYYGILSPASVALADRIERETGVPAIILDGRIGESFAALRLLGTVLGVAARGDALGLYAEQAIDSIRGTLLIVPPAERPLVYYGLGFDGLETGLAGAVAMADIDEAGAINVAASLGSGELTRVTPADIRFWNPDVIIAERRSFYDALRRGRSWRNLAAVRNKRVFLEPAAPFGWIGDPPSVNRLIGLYWLSSLFYKGVAQTDLRTLVTEFYQTFYNVKPTDPQLDALLRAAEPPPPPAPPPSVPAAPPASSATGIPGLPGIGALPTLPGAPTPLEQTPNPGGAAPVKP